MSMSQEEIEALMNGLDIADDESEAEEVSQPVKVNTKEIEELLSQTEDIKDEIDDKSEDIIDDTVVSINEIKNNSENDAFIKNSEIEDLLKDIESSSEPIVEEVAEKTPEVKIEEIKTESNEKNISRSEDDIVKDWTSNKINEGVFPLPAEKDTKVVNQLTQVANDSEEKVSQIFDVLSFTLDNNNEIRKVFKDYDNFINSQVNLLNSLSTKFPNIKVFDGYLNSAKNTKETLKSINNLLNEEDNQIFQAMELMQFNDINRQKIERVMAVIRKLSLYLNNLFEDDGNSKEIAVAKHIPGDDSDDLIGDDLDKLIAEFSNNK
ncbi:MULTISPECIES: hypothetical protein [Arcobacter]|jgi:hypothetical protein|uniref:Chemotaxis protein n=1 Tax=Arcobacter ellisii TaxID=913109 RepID=A0A347UAX0_9BACT|nr:hypothetical protein [Arcobacter ellisii]AXX95998.1 hypothetical protein AELL_2380 [Arcobacter ellisii]RXI29372.1 hypothetical protein CP962_11260 [Arcobacter ellisii]